VRFIRMEIHRDFCEVAICEYGKGSLDRADPDAGRAIGAVPNRHREPQRACG
jgi:hypothetical protein